MRFPRLRLAPDWLDPSIQNGWDGSKAILAHTVQSYGEEEQHHADEVFGE